MFMVEVILHSCLSPPGESPSLNLSMYSTFFQRTFVQIMDCFRVDNSTHVDIRTTHMNNFFENKKLSIHI